METLALRVENVEKYFPSAASGWRALLHPISQLTVPALRGVSIELKRGEVLALVGANGAGKSTLLRILTTLLIPTRGRAWVGGFDVAQEPAKVRLFAGLNNLSRSEASQRIRELADPFGIGALLDRVANIFVKAANTID